MTRRKAKVRNEYGIHCRPSAIIVKEAQGYPGSIRVINDDGRKADAKNLLEVIGLGVGCGQIVQIDVDGPDEELTCEHMTQLFETNFDFPR